MIVAVLLGAGAYAGEDSVADAQDAGAREAQASSGTPHLDFMSFRFSTYLQRGRGYQSQDSIVGTGPGSEAVQIYQPIIMARISQGPSVRHTILMPIDIVSAASADALDAIGHASRENEAGGLDVTTTFNADRPTRYNLHYGFHLEEPFKSGFIGFGVAHEFAERNATLSSSIEFIYDGFDDLQYFGDDNGWKQRVTSNVNIALSQLLSPTTIMSVAYGMTTQSGTLETTYNSLPVETGGRMSERFPSDRLRHAFTARLAQMIPGTRTTLRGSYRFYADTFGLMAHTADVQLYQYLAHNVVLRGTYRFHHQSGVDFFRTSVSNDFGLDLPRTGDSDLARFDAHEVGGGLRIYLGNDYPLTDTSRFIDAMYFRYARSNGMNIDIGTIGYGQTF